MIKAIFKQGAIQLLQPPPAEWLDGQELDVEPSKNGRHDADDDAWPPPITSLEELYADDLTPEEIEADFRELNEMCAQSDPVQDEIMMQAINQHRAEQKELMRKRMGLS